MSEAPETPQATARSPLAGCAILIVAMLVMIFLVVFSVFSLFRQYKEIVKFTGHKPVEIEVVGLEGRESQINSLSEQLEAFRQQLFEEDEVALRFTADQINLLIASCDILSELRGTFSVESISDEGMRIRISFPLNGIPRLSKEGEEGFFTTDPRYLNGVLVARPVLLKGEVVIKIDDIEVEGAEVPEEFVEQMSPYRPAERYKAHEIIGPIMRQLTRVTTEGDKVVLSRVAGEAPADAITDEQVDAAGSRFFMVFGGAACLFLIFVGIMIVLGLRQRARKDGSATDA